MENPTNDSIELAIAFLKECGQRLTEVSPRGITGLLNFKQSFAVCDSYFYIISVVSVIEYYKYGGVAEQQRGCNAGGMA